jgi:L-lactate dehydrogenase complex protein LldG
MGTRDTVLHAVRAALGGGERREPQAIAAEAETLLRAPELIRPRLPNIGLVELFAERVLSPKVSATLERVAALGELPGAVQRYAAAQDLPPAIALQPATELLRLDWGGIEIRKTITPNEAVGVGLAQWAIAETGSLVFHSGPDMPILFNFLPLHHIVAIRAGAIVAYLENYAAAAASAGPAPRNVNLITGISGTTDIEGSYVRGAHGPRFLHVVLVEEPPA